MTFLLLTITMISLPPEGSDLFSAANEAYQQQNYETAIEHYTALQTRFNIKSPALFFNLGNAWNQKGNLGKAVLYYEAALTTDPHFEPARRNLETTLENTKRNLPPPDPDIMEEGNLLHYYPLSPFQSLLLTHICLVVTLALLLIRHWRESSRLLWICRMLPVLALLFFGLTIATDYASLDDPKLAVTVAEEAPVYFSMNEMDSPRFLLYEGDRVLVDRIEGDWIRVNAYGGERGWMRKDNAGIVEYSSL